MIIIAATIILTLDGNNIIGRANEARTESDIAARKEAASVYLGEYKLKVFKNKIDPNEISAIDYVKNQMKSEGLKYDDVTIGSDGQIYIGVVGGKITEVVKKVPVGAKVEGYVLNKKTDYVTDGKERSGEEAVPKTDENDNFLYKEDGTIDTVVEKYTGTAQTLKMSTDVSWKYVGTDEKGNVLIAADVTDSLPSISLSYQGGVEYGIPLLDTICNTFYTTNKGTARNMKLEDVKSILKYNGPCGYYLNSGEPYENDVWCYESVNTGVFNGVFGINSTIEYPHESYFNIKPDDQYIDANEAQKNIIYTQNTYLLSSASASSQTTDTQQSYGVYYVDNAELNAKNWTYDYWYFNGWLNYDYPVSGKIRPIVTLNSTVNATYDETSNTLTLM